MTIWTAQGLPAKDWDSWLLFVGRWNDAGEWVDGDAWDDGIVWTPAN